MRLIDADAFDKVLKDAQTECRKNGGNFRFGVLGEVRGNLALFPTVDRPEIVRCKDCKHRPTDPENKGVGQSLVFPDEICPCKIDDHWYSWMPKDDWFCADGKRKDDDA